MAPAEVPELTAHGVPLQLPVLEFQALPAMYGGRSEHDPRTAARLAHGYLEEYPDGALVEEALALSIQAVADLHSAAVTSFAERYLRRYPNGRFRRTAEQALAQPTP